MNGTSLNNGNATENTSNSIPEGIFTPIDGTFEFPKCRRKCKSYYIGRSDFKPVNTSIDIRSGDVAEFACKPGYFVEGEVCTKYLIRSTDAHTKYVLNYVKIATL